MSHRGASPDPLDPSRLANKYRRSFSYRIAEGSAQLENQIAGAVRLSTGDYPDILEDYLCISRKRQKNATAMVNLQMSLLQELAVQEQSIKVYKSTVAPEPKAQRVVESQIFMHRLIANTIRNVGDGIVWRSLEFDRSIPRILSAQPVKHVVLEDGLAAELREWFTINRQPSKTAILNVITNCMAMGDVTSIDSDGSVEVIEVKTTKTKSSRKIRQRNQLRDAAGILSLGIGIVEGKEVRIGSSPIVPTNHLKELRLLLDECSINGWSSMLVAEHCYLECIDFKKLGLFEDAAPKMEEAYMRSCQKWGKDRVDTMSSIDVISFSPNIAPFTIFPFDDKTCVELAMGSKCFMCHLNVSAVLRQFEGAGWTVLSAMEEAITQTKGEAVIIATKRGIVCHIPPSDFGKMLLETLTPTSIIEECEFISSLDPKAAEGYGLWMFDGEASQWN